MGGYFNLIHEHECNKEFRKLGKEAAKNAWDMFEKRTASSKNKSDRYILLSQYSFEYWLFYN